MITTVLLDLDDTILMDDEASDIAFAATAAHAAAVTGIDADALIAAARTIADREWADGPFPEWLQQIGTGPLEGLRARFEGTDPHWATMREWGPNYRRTVWQQALAAVGVDDTSLAATLDTMFGDERAAANPWCHGAEEALHALGSRYRLGMVTNGIPDVQWEKIRRTNLEPLFAGIVVSGEVGEGKPAASVFARALELTDSTPEQTIMVGDNWMKDAIGPAKLGIRGVWINMNRPRPDDSAPWLEISSLAELPALLDSMPDA